MTRLLFSFFCIFVTASGAQAQINILGRVDVTKGAVANQKLNLNAIEVEVEKGFNKDKLFLSGIAIGIRKESEKLDEGTYLTFRTFHKWGLLKKHVKNQTGQEKLVPTLNIIPSVTVLYGSPGTTMNRASQERYGEFVPYVRIFPLRNAPIPGLDIEPAGLIYPELSISARKEFCKIFSVEPVLGVKVIRFGVAEYDGVNASYRKNTAFLPSFGVRIGLKIN